MYSYLKSFGRWRHLCLLIALVAFLIIEPIASSFGAFSSLFDVFFILIMIVLSLILSQGKFWWMVALLFAVPAAILLIAARFLSAPAGDLSLYSGHGLGAVFFVVVACKIVASVFRSGELSLDSVFGAVCGYLLLGVAWSLTYAMVYTAAPDSFHIGDSLRPQMAESHNSRSVFVYYSFVTLTTLGYGDVAPSSITARTLSWVEAVAGQMYIAILVAGLISALVEKNATLRRQQK